MHLKVLARLELFAASRARLPCVALGVHIGDMLLQIAVVTILLAALGALWLHLHFASTREIEARWMRVLVQAADARLYRPWRWEPG